jgi:hypothetical protein
MWHVADLSRTHPPNGFECPFFGHLFSADMSNEPTMPKAREGPKNNGDEGVDECIDVSAG